MIEASTPKRPATGKEVTNGDIESFRVEIAENGFTASVSRKVKGDGKNAESYPSYNSETFVFPTAGKLLAFLRAELKGAGATDVGDDAGDE